MPESTQLAAYAAIEAPVGRRAQILAGVTDSFSAGLGIFPFGIALGLLVMQLGLPWWVAPRCRCQRSPALLSCCSLA